MGKKTKLPPVFPPQGRSPTFEPEYDSGCPRLPPITGNTPLVSTIQGQAELPMQGRRTRPGTGLYQIPNPRYAQPPPVWVQGTRSPTDGRMPYPSYKDMMARRAANSQIDLTLPVVSGQMNQPPRTRLLNREQMPRKPIGEKPMRLSPPAVPKLNLHLSPDLAVHGQKIYAPVNRSPCEGMEDPFSSLSAEIIAIGARSHGSLNLPPVNDKGLISLTAPRSPCCSRLATETADKYLSPSPPAVKLPPIRKHKRRHREDH